MERDVCTHGKLVKECAMCKRNISLDVLRILCMLLIILGHAMIHGHVLESLPLNSVNYYLVNTLRSFLSVHVNCFVLISGYFLCTHEFRFSKALSIWVQALFWSFALYILLVISGIAQFDVKLLLRACLPFTQQRYWFVTTYLLMYVLTPILNAAIRAMSQKQHAFFIAIFFAVYIVLQNVFFWEKFTSTNSYDPLFFAFLYMIAAYCRLYSAKRTQTFYILCYVFMCIFSAAWKIGIAWITNRIAGEAMGDNIFLSYSSATMVIASICLFRYFEGLHITVRLFQKAAPFLSSLTFGVYLIHEQPEVREFLWNKLLRPTDYSQSPFLVLLLLGMTLLVFLLCASIEYLRQKISQFLSTKKLIMTVSDKVSNRAASLTGRVFQFTRKEK